MSPIAAARPLDELLEKEWEHQIIGTAAKPGLARQLGWRVYHTLRSKGSQPGYPDWTLVRERVIFLELKREAGVLSAAQRDWLRALLDAYAETYVARPSDLEDIGRVLAARGNPWGRGLTSVRAERARDRLTDQLRKEIDRGNH